MAKRVKASSSTKPTLDAAADIPDLRDRYYEPALVKLPSEIKPNKSMLTVRNQGQEGACTGFSLAAAIDFLNASHGRSNLKVSVRMLYEMAKRFDEWTGEDYSGSSLRGAFRGWFNNGVCTEDSWSYKTRPPFDTTLTVDRAKEAMENPLGAYYRLRPNLTDYHSALTETGVVCASARVHQGWFNSLGRNKEILKSDSIQGGHAFVIVGYNNDGFWVQNSWGKSWGDKGTALWTYEDWAKNIMDAWVFRLAVRTPHNFDRRSGFSSNDPASIELASKAPRRNEIAGHFLHVDDGKFHEKGRYSSKESDILETAKLIRDSDKYQHLLFYAHGGLNPPKASAKRIRAMKDVFKDNGIYPFHFMYDTGLGEEFKDVIFNKDKKAKARVGGFSDFTDKIFEATTRKLGTIIWDEMKSDADVAFHPGNAGYRTLEIFAEELAEKDIKIHLVGHSTGAILHGHLLNALDSIPQWTKKINSCSLLAPACTMDFYKEKYGPRLKGVPDKAKLPLLNLYCLTDEQELDDKVTALYRKSLLYLVSNAFERKRENEKEDGKPIMGMQKFHGPIKRNPKIKFFYSKEGRPPQSKSETHGGFDNDPVTMNSLLKKILKGPVKRPFEEKDLNY
ncbi:MAG: C1 family peptidase [Candidatus Nitronauta litoralis]|uniref:C1 family peptidase n=1 Tax=Candidatus Nitronauta litoralis TaxID=2705533 RepID=A0A7T0BY11_9BACT|nr:MAG: C1 family peptidase [Candidatus Nitronauta litoralis]